MLGANLHASSSKDNQFDDIMMANRTELLITLRVESKNMEGNEIERQVHYVSLLPLTILLPQRESGLGRIRRLTVITCCEFGELDMFF